MEILTGLIGAAFALLGILMLYVGGAAVVLRLIEKLLPAKRTPERDLTARPYAS